MITHSLTSPRRPVNSKNGNKSRLLKLLQSTNVNWEEGTNVIKCKHPTSESNLERRLGSLPSVRLHFQFNVFKFLIVLIFVILSQFRLTSAIWFPSFWREGPNTGSRSLFGGSNNNNGNLKVRTGRNLPQHQHQTLFLPDHYYSSRSGNGGSIEFGSNNKHNNQPDRMVRKLPFFQPHHAHYIVPGNFGTTSGGGELKRFQPNLHSRFTAPISGGKHQHKFSNGCFAIGGVCRKFVGCLIASGVMLDNQGCDKSTNLVCCRTSTTDNNNHHSSHVFPKYNSYIKQNKNNAPFIPSVESSNLATALQSSISLPLSQNLKVSLLSTPSSSLKRRKLREGRQLSMMAGLSGNNAFEESLPIFDTFIGSSSPSTSASSTFNQNEGFSNKAFANSNNILHGGTSTSSTSNTVINDPMCGQPINRRSMFIASRRVLDGEPAGFGSFPWQAHIRIGKGKCGGVLVNRRHVVTAGHCVRDKDVSSILVYLGEYNLKESDPLPGQIFGVDRVEVHPNFSFSPAADRFDVAILWLDHSVEYAPHILPICLPERGRDPDPGTTAYVAGWGALIPDDDDTTSDTLLDSNESSNGFSPSFLPFLLNGPISGQTGISSSMSRSPFFISPASPKARKVKRPSELQVVNVPVIENSRCERWHWRAGFKVRIWEEMLCAGYPEGGKDSCKGDSGGPLMVQQADGRWVLIGLVSAGFSCGKPGQPGIYHRISSSSDWISRHIYSF